MGSSRLAGFIIAVALIAPLTGCGSNADVADSPDPLASPSASPTKNPVTLSDLTVKDTRSMTRAEARRWLRKWTSQTDRNELRDERGEWVPQISSKCTGLTVDIDNGMPDGTSDVTNVSTQQILGFHLALNRQFSAVTTESGNLSNRATTGPCAGKAVWIALVPTGYPRAGLALEFCKEYNFPYGECAARYIPMNDAEATQMVLPGDPGDDGAEPSERPSDDSTPQENQEEEEPGSEPDPPRVEDEQPEPEYFVAPSVVGLERREAEASLRALGFRASTGPDVMLGATSIDTMSDCYVTSQTPREGSRVRINIGPGGEPIPPSFRLKCAP